MVSIVRRLGWSAAVVGAGALVLASVGPEPVGLAGPAGSGAAAPVITSHGSTKTVGYRGVRVSVPATWPVYNLSADPARCVRLDRHAVYVGTPGPRQHCPARALGRTEALVLQPLGGGPMLPGTRVVTTTGLSRLRLAATVIHTWRVAVTDARVLITATYQRRPAMVLHALGLPRAAAARAGRQPAANGGGSKSVGPALVERTGHGLGFDACTAPAVQTMRTWLDSPYRIAGTYLGGVNWACTYGNFTPDWVRQVAAQGWGFIPIYVGLQAPCVSLSRVAKIDPTQAAQQGVASADDAVALAAHFGYGPGTPIYFDMEGYNSAVAGCSQAVLTFLGAWTSRLHTDGYLSGVYSSSGSGMVDLAAAYADPSFTSPDAIWFAHWNGDPVLTDPAFIPNADWPDHQRLHQNYGGHHESWGGQVIDVDNDVADGPIAGLPSTAPPAPGTLAIDPTATTLSPGSQANATLRLHSAGPGPELVDWQVSPPQGLRVQPGRGSTVVPPGAAVTIHLTLRADPSLAAGRYDLPTTATSGPETLTESFLLATVAPQAGDLSTSYPIMLYAADPDGMAIAQRLAAGLGLPPGDVAGNFETAWNTLTAGHTLVLAIGSAATNALYYNPCGWANPAGSPAGSTPFSFLGQPLQQPPGADIFENAAADNSTNTATLAALLSHYALAGTLPNEGVTPPGPTAPQRVCSGSPDIPPS